MAETLGNGTPPIAQSQERVASQTPGKTRTRGERTDSRGPGRKKAQGRRPEGRSPGTAQLRHMEGFDRGPGRGLQPREAPTAPHGEREEIKNERQFSEELVGQVKESLRDDLEQLIDIRKRQTEEQFEDFLRDSGHSYYLALFNHLTSEKAGTDHRSRHIDKAKLTEFFNSDAGLTKAYDIMHLKLIEKSAAAAVALSVSPDIPKQKGLKNETMTRRKGGLLRQPARSIFHWGGEQAGLRHGRGEGYEEWPFNGALSWALRTKGRLTAILTIGGVLTAGALPAVAGGLYLFRKGETLDIQVSPEAIQAYIGNPQSPTPEARGPNAAQVEWSKRFNKVDPTDFRINAEGHVERKDRVGGTGIDDKSLRDELAGLADTLLEFQKQNGIRSEQRQIGINWILDGTGNRTRQGTPSERWIDKFDPDKKGRQDKNGNTRLQDRIPFIEYPVTREVEVRKRDSSGKVIMEGGTPQMIQAENPDGTPMIVDGKRVMKEARDTASGDIIMIGARPVTETRQIIDMIPARDAAGNERLDTSGNVILVPRTKQIYNPDRRLMLNRLSLLSDLPMTRRITDQSGEVVDIPIMDPLRDDASNEIIDSLGNRVMVPRMRAVTNADIQMDILVNADGSPRWERNPLFDKTNLDVAGNNLRALQAITETLEEDIPETIQDIFDEKTDHTNDILAEIKAKKEARTHPDKSSLEAQRTKLENDATQISEELDTVKKYQSHDDKRKQEITKLEEKQKRIIGQVTDASGNPFPDINSAQTALNEVRQSGTTVITIAGQRIESIPDAYDAIESTIEDRVNRSQQARRLAEADTRVTTATTTLAGAETTLITTESARISAEQALITAKQEFIDASGPAELQRLQANLLNARQAQDQAQHTLTVLNSERTVITEPDDELERQINETTRTLGLITTQVDDTTRQVQALQALQTNITNAQRDHTIAQQNEINARTALENARRILTAEEQRQGDAQGELTKYTTTISNSDEIKDARNKIQQQNELVTNIINQFTEEGANRVALQNAKIEKEDEFGAIIRSHESAFDAVTRLNGVNGVILDENTLQTESFDNLIRRIDQAGGARGIDRNMLLHAMIQARFRQVRGAPILLDFLPAQQRAIQDVMKDIDDRKKGVEKNITRAESGNIETPELDALERAANRYDTIVETFTAKLATDTAIDQFLGIKRDPATRTITYLNASAPEVKQRYNATEQKLTVAANSIFDSVFGQSSDNAVRYKEQMGSEAALQRNLDLLGDNPQDVERDLVNLIRSNFNISGITGATPLGEAVERVRTELGASFKTRFARFLAEEYLIKHILPMVGKF